MLNDFQILAILVVALVSAVLALRLGKALYV